jgi:hypothetical protein
LESLPERHTRLKIRAQIEMFSTNMKDLPHSTPLHAPESEFVNV